MICFCGMFFISTVKGQTLYLKNTTNTYNAEVQTITKYGISCVGSSYTTMPDLFAGPGGSDAQAYPAGYGGNPDHLFDITYDTYTDFGVQYCGVPSLNNPIGIGVFYDIYTTSGTDVLVYFHY